MDDNEDVKKCKRCSDILLALEEPFEPADPKEPTINDDVADKEVDSPYADAVEEQRVVEEQNAVEEQLAVEDAYASLQ